MATTTLLCALDIANGLVKPRNAVTQVDGTLLCAECAGVQLSRPGPVRVRVPVGPDPDRRHGPARPGG